MYEAHDQRFSKFVNDGMMGYALLNSESATWFLDKKFFLQYNKIGL